VGEPNAAGRAAAEATHEAKIGSELGP
jgi:hypothetical protein